MARIATLFIITIMLTGCFGSSNKSNSNSSVPADNYSYYFAEQSGFKLYSFEHETSQQELVFSDPTELEYSIRIDENGLSSYGVLFMLKEGVWHFVTPDDNTVKVIADGSNISEVCDSTALETDAVTYLYYATPGEDADCSEEADNISYRVDTSMGVDASPVVINSELYLADERQTVLTNNTANGFLVKKEYTSDTLLFSNLDFTNTVNLENNVTGYIRVTSLANHDSIIVRYDNKLFDVTPGQLAAGNIGEAFHSGASVTVHASRNQFFYSEGLKLYQYDLAKKEPTLIHELATGYYGDITTNSKGLLVHLNTGSADFLHINTTDLNSIVVKNVTLEATERSSRMDSIAGGFTYNNEKADGTKTAYFVSNDGEVTAINNAKWVNTASGTLDVGSLPLLLKFGETSNTLSKWSVSTQSNEFVYGEFTKEVISLRTDPNIRSGRILLSTYSEEGRGKGRLYVLDINKANSLKSLGDTSDYSVAN